MNLTDKQIIMLHDLLLIREGWRVIRKDLDKKAKQKLDAHSAKEIIRRSGILRGVEIVVDDILSKYYTTQDEINGKYEIIERYLK